MYIPSLCTGAMGLAGVVFQAVARLFSYSLEFWRRPVERWGPSRASASSPVVVVLHTADLRCHGDARDYIVRPLLKTRANVREPYRHACHSLDRPDWSMGGGGGRGV